MTERSSDGGLLILSGSNTDSTHKMECCLCLDGALSVYLFGKLVFTEKLFCVLKQRQKEFRFLL